MSKQLRTLIIEDSEDDARLMLRELKRGGYEPVFERVETAEAMKEALGNRQWDILISDYSMPQFSGLAALNLLKKIGMDIPFIIVSGNIGEDVAVEAMKAGAHDYIMKNNLARLVPAIERELREAEVRLDKKRAEEELRRYHVELERRVEERTAQLKAVNEQLELDIAGRKKAEEELEQRVVELNAANEELTRFNNVAVGRELRMIELKKEINELRAEEGKPPHYKLDFEEK